MRSRRASTTSAFFAFLQKCQYSGFVGGAGAARGLLAVVESRSVDGVGAARSRSPDGRRPPTRQRRSQVLRANVRRRQAILERAAACSDAGRAISTRAHRARSVAPRRGESTRSEEPARGFVSPPGAARNHPRHSGRGNPRGKFRASRAQTLDIEGLPNTAIAINHGRQLRTHEPRIPRRRSVAAPGARRRAAPRK